MECFVNLRTAERTEPAFDSLHFASLEEAYLDACAAIPDAAADLLRQRRNPFRCAFIISGTDGSLLLEIPFTDILPPSERDGVAVELPSVKASTTTRLHAEIARSHHLIRRATELHRRATCCIDISRTSTKR
jgi:hypothetical protein